MESSVMFVTLVKLVSPNDVADLVTRGWENVLAEEGEVVRGRAHLERV